MFGKYQLLQYKRVSNKIRMIIKKRKRLNFNEFIDGLNPNSNSKNFWKVIKLFKNSGFFSSKVAPNIGRMELVDRFINSFALIGMINSFSEPVSSRYSFFFDMQFQLHELEEIISSAREGSSPENDLINYFILKLLSTIAVQKLLDIFNKILSKNSFPEKWREYDIILLPKSNKMDFRL